MNAKEVAAALGGDASSAMTILAPGPGRGPGDRSLSVRLDPGAPDGFRVHSFANDPWQLCRDHVRERLGLGRWTPARPVVVPVRPVRPVRSDDPSGITLARRIWSQSSSLRGSLAERYLASRGLTVDDRACEALRFNPDLRFGGRRVPGLVALFRSVTTDEPTGIHRIFLDPEGRRLERWMLGVARGSAIKLADVVDTLTVGEGIETSLAAAQLGFAPAWALGSASGIANLPVLPGIKTLRIAGEINDHGANKKAAKECAQRWLAAGARVTWLEPEGADDANDVLLEQSR